MQEIIVYRSPAEAAFWHAMNDTSVGAFVFPIICSMIAFGFTVYFSDDFWSGRVTYKWRSRLSMLFGAVAGLAVFYFMTRNFF